ncbi:MAG TPA: alkaline phosphatase D family protein [Gaiellaceae bacterium]|nr:alkaline phosphatase D family protein [Gaiellaceae bacterium]
MRRLLLAMLAALVLAPAAAATPGFSYGVAAGELTSTSAVVWTRSNEFGTVRLHLWPAPRKGMPFVQIDLKPTAARDRVVQRRVFGLRPNTRYTYMFSTPYRRSRIAAGGEFRTAPAPGDAQTIRFAISGDADGTRDPRTGKPAYNVFQVYGRMAAERNHFNINLGDTIYSDSEVAGVPPALTVAAKWGKYKENLGFGHLRNLRRGTGLYSHWDDHEFINDFTRAEHGAAIYDAGVRAFRDYAPVTYSSRNGLYRTFRWGKHLELFFLDERSFRSAKARGACGNDLAPTAPQPVRNAFAALVPSLANPVPQSCLDAIADPTRTMLGARQFAAFTRAIKASTATWKVIVNEVPIQQYYALPYDRWEGYAAERDRLLRFLQANVRNVVFLTTDTHANFVNEVRLSTLGPGGPAGTGIWEVVTGPVATNTQNREVDSTLGRAGLGSAIVALFYKPQPPNGVGMACASGNVYSYASVRVTGTALTVTPRDQSGKLVREETGVPCGPFTFRAR